MDTAAMRMVAVPDGRTAATTLVAFLRFTKDLVVSRRRFVGLLLVVGGTFAWLDFRISSRERLKSVSSLPPTKRPGTPPDDEAAQAAEASAALAKQKESAQKKKAKRASSRFSARLRVILKMCFPSLMCKESINTVLLCLMLVARSALSVVVAITMGHAAGAIVATDWKNFLRQLRKFALIGIPASLVNSGIKYITSILSLRFQRRLTDRLNKNYVTGVNFYKATELPEFKIDNVDQRVTTDVEQFCEQGCEMFCDVFKPTLDILLNTWQLGRDVGAWGPTIMVGYFGLAVAVKVAIMPNFKELVKKRSELVGNYRTAHARLITHAEEIAFYEGGARERSIIRQRFDAVYWHMRHIATKSAAVGVVDTWIEKYGASIAGYFIMCLPVFFSSTQKSVADNTNDFIKRRQIMMDLARGLGSLLIVGTQLKMLSGTTARVSEVFESVKQLNEKGTSRFEIAEEEALSSGNDDGGSNGGGGGGGGAGMIKSESTLFREEISFLEKWRAHVEKLRDEGRRHPQAVGGSSSPRSKKTIAGAGQVVVGPVVKFTDVQLVSPDGRHLVKTPLNFEVPPGTNIMLTGPNGCGKSSLFRVLGELWPPYSGVVTKPDQYEMLFVPQKPYLVMGTLRDQLIYPDSKEEMLAKGVSDTDLMQLLSLVDPPGIIVDRWTFDTEANWSLTLSGGQKQRVAMARLFYHQPKYAIMDECTSAVSDDVTDKIYETCSSLGITLFTIAHQKTVIKHHKLILRFDGKGGWAIENVTPDSAMH